jgi:hypothetical protein
MARKKRPPPPPPDPAEVRAHLEREVIDKAVAWFDAKTSYSRAAIADAEDALLMSLVGLGMVPPSRKRRG